MSQLIFFPLSSLVEEIISSYQEREPNSLTKEGFSPSSDSVTLITNLDNGGVKIPNTHLTVPIHFRCFHDLGISGSAQFSRRNLPGLFSQISRPDVIIFDLRQETHGFVIPNGDAVSWFSYRDWDNKSFGQNKGLLMKRYLQQFESVLQSNRIIYKPKMDNKDELIQYAVPTGMIPPEGVWTEQEEIQFYNSTASHQVQYKWYPITDHLPPPESVLLEMETFLNDYALKNNGILPHIHVHCRAGNGRTTTVLCCLEMMIRARRRWQPFPSFREILYSQHIAGGINLLEFPQNWKAEYFKERIRMMLKFYQKQLFQWQNK